MQFDHAVHDPDKGHDEQWRKDIVEKGLSVTACKRKDTALIAWAKAAHKYVDISRTSVWGNPFKVGVDGTRDEVCDMYAQYLQGRSDLLGRLGELSGKVLGCWCYPERCHGDELIRSLKEREV